MSLEPITLLPVGTSASHRTLLRDAATLAFQGQSVRVAVMKELGAALDEPPADGVEIVVLITPKPAAIEQALNACDGVGLPRWGIVVLGADLLQPGVEAVSLPELEPRLVARALRSSVAQRALRRDWARERGDVWTIGRRLTHDLRNPLGCIVTTAEMLKEILATEAPAQLPFAESIVESSAEMLELIDRVHFMAKASAQPRAPEVFDMEAARQAAIDRLQREITQRGAVVTAPEDWPEIRGVRPWLEVVWGNLIVNALRHGGQRPRIETTWRRDADEWRFEIRDEGPGVAAERLEHLFTPFHQLHRRHGGGLGLSVVRRLVELHGGRCGHEARTGGGATFYFTLPCTRAAATAVCDSPIVASMAPAPRLAAEGGLTACARPAG